MMRLKITILNRNGINLAAATQLVRHIERLEAQVRVKRHGKTGDANSLLDLSAMQIPQGAVVTFDAEGKQATEALDAIEGLIKNRFYLEPLDDERQGEGAI